MKQQNINTLGKDWELTDSQVANVGLLVGGFALLTAIGALIRIPLPFTPIPLTMQTFFVILSGVMIGSKKGVMSQAVYVVAGTAGLPVFAGMTTGLALLAGPTGGYLIGFIAAPAVVAFIRDKSLGRMNLILSITAGTAVIFIFGNLWLWNVTRGNLSSILNIGFFPFLPGAVIKGGLIIAIVELIGNKKKNK